MELQIQQIAKQRNGKHFTGAAFEDLIHQALDSAMPFSVLPNVSLFRPDLFRSDVIEDNAGPAAVPLGANPLAYEIDNLFHVRRDEVDYIVIVEAKHQLVAEEKGKWVCYYHGQPKLIQKQLLNHAATITRYLKPVGRNAELRIHAVVVSSDPLTTRATAKRDGNVKLEKCSFESLPSVIHDLCGAGEEGESRTQVMRVAQSEYLTLLRLGMPVKALGHPELRQAIHYVNRCKRYIDQELYRSFHPSVHHWAINGTAGMGKSVLLAYGIAVFLPITESRPTMAM